MTLSRNTTATKPTSSPRMTASSPTTRISVNVKKPVDGDTNSARKFTSSAIKGKLTSGTSNSPRKIEKSPSNVTPTRVTNTSPVKISSPIAKKLTSPVTKCTTIEKSIKSTVIKSSALKTPERKLTEVKKELSGSTEKPPVVSKIRTKLDSPVSRLTSLPISPVKTVTNSVKNLTPNKSMRSPTSRLNTSRDAKPTTLDKTKIVGKTVPSTVPKKVASPVKLNVPAKIIKSVGTVVKNDPVAKTKPKVVLNKTAISERKPLTNTPSRISAKSPTVSVTTPTNRVDELFTPEPVERVELCSCIETIDKCENFNCNSPPLDDHTVSQSFDVARAFKVAEQLIRIQGSDENLQTIIDTGENVTTVNWDDIIRPCVEVTNSTHDDRNATTRIEVERNFGIENSIEYAAELCKNSTTYESIETIANCEENENNLVTVTEPKSNEIFCKSSCSIDETETDEKLQNVNVIVNDDKITEWTIVIDEFRPDIINVDRTIEEKTQIIPYQSTAENVTNTTGMTYAQVLKKIPKILANSTNLEPREIRPKFNVNLRIKEYPMYKKVEAICSTNFFLNDVENFDYEYDADDAEFAVTRKKNYKKIKNFSKRSMKNNQKDCKYVENYADVFVTPVWKNIY